MVYLLFVAALVAGGILYQEGHLHPNYPDPDQFPVRGIDVSHHQGTIDWAAVRRASISFAYIKASEGAAWRDPLFVENWHGTGQAGIAWGAYHYFSFCSSGLVQARNFVQARSAAEADADLPPAVDVESEGNCQVPEGTDVRRELAAFLEEVERSCRCRPILYVTDVGYEAIVRGNFENYPLWVRGVGLGISMPERWLFMQYADNGRVPGISTLVDLDLFNGSEEQFNILLKDGALWTTSSGPRVK